MIDSMRVTRLCIFCAFICSPLGARETVRRLKLAAGTQWETTVLIRQAQTAGPTVLVLGGVHGNEPAGWRAARQIQHWPVVRGRLIVIARVNVGGCRTFKRFTPGKPAYDLNRQFPAARGVLPAALWKLLKRYRPDWVVDLHESQGYHFEKRRLGNSLIVCKNASARAQARRMAAQASHYTTGKKYHWILKGPPIKGSLARAAARSLGCKSMIIETCVKEPMARRVRYHRMHLHKLLSELKMLPAGFALDSLLPAKRAQARSLRIAIFSDAGATGARDIERCSDGRELLVTRRISGAAIRGGALRQFDLVIFPGGSGGGQAKALGESGRAAVRLFVRRGGGYLGVCAGAYLASRHYKWSLGLLNARVLDTAHWARGNGTVTVELSAQARKLFGATKSRIRIHYAQGPLLAHQTKGPKYEVLGTFRTEIRKNEKIPQGVMLGAHAMARTRYGKGRVVLFSPHPEAAPGLRGFIRRSMAWVAGRD